MKKLLSLALALVLCFSLTVPAMAAGKSGDKTIIENGRTFTLSNQILYTATSANMQSIDMGSMNIFIEGEPYNEEWFGPVSQYLDEAYWPGVNTVYAIPENTVITLPDGLLTATAFMLDVTWENGMCHATEFNVINFPGYSTVSLEGTNFFLTLEVQYADPVDNGTGASNPGDNIAGTISFYVPENIAAANPFTSSDTPSTTPSKPAFTDVADSAYYAAPVAWAVENGITSGTTTTTFSPNATCTTAQILTFLWRAKGSPEPTSKTNTFTDIKESDYYYKAALWAKENGLVSGSTFNGSTPCTRAATVTYLWKLAGSPSAASASFTDVPATAKYSQAVAWAVSKGITSGTSATTFSPDTTCTRAQIVTFLYRAYAD